MTSSAGKVGRGLQAPRNGGALDTTARERQAHVSTAHPQTELHTRHPRPESQKATSLIPAADSGRILTRCSVVESAQTCCLPLRPWYTGQGACKWTPCRAMCTHVSSERTTNACTSIMESPWHTQLTKTLCRRATLHLHRTNTSAKSARHATWSRAPPQAQSQTRFGWMMRLQGPHNTIRKSLI